MTKRFDLRIRALTLLQLVADGVICFLATMLAESGALADGMSFREGPAAGSSLFPPFIVAAVMVLLFSFVGAYRRGAVPVGFVSTLERSLTVVLFVAFGIWMTYGQLADRDFGWRSEIIFVSYSVIGLLLIRTAAHFVRRRAIGAPRVLILGHGPEARDIANDIRQGRGAERKIVGFYPVGASLCLLGPTDRLFSAETPLQQVVTQRRIDEVIVAVPDQRGGVLPMDQLLDCRVRGVPILDLAGFYEEVRSELPLNALKSSWLVYGGGFEQGRLRRASKRIFDIVVASLLLVITFPVLLLAVLAIRFESSGPILYRQERVGLRGKSFDCVKLRSMCVDAEKDGVARWATKGDARITRVGAFIRKTRIDELPQLFCVLMGSMSLVGPRPERPGFVEQLKQTVPYYDLRHCVKPGITGWAQVRFTYGSCIEDARRKHQFDLYYVKNQSLLLDLQVLLETVSVVLFREGAQ